MTVPDGSSNTMMMRLAVFDLDYTVWQPEMYQLWGPPSLAKMDSPKCKGLPPSVLKLAQTNVEGKILMDRSDTPITVFDGASHALSEINRLREVEGHDIRAAVASRTDEPSWAKTCMKHLVVKDGATLKECFGNLVQISYKDKRHHLQNLHHQTGIPFAEMCFFDNEYGNIRSVSKLGVKCVYTPDGMTKKAWKTALDMFDAKMK